MALIGPDVGSSGGSGGGSGGSVPPAYNPGAPDWEPSYSTSHDDNDSHVLNSDTALTASALYEIVLQPVVPTNFVQGWLGVGATVAAGAGQRLSSSYPMQIRLASDSKIAFRRDSTTEYAYRISVTRIG